MYSKLREKTGKQYVKKYQVPFGPLWQDQNTPYVSQVTGQMLGNFDLSLPDPTILPQQTTELFSYGSEDGALGKTTVSATNTGISSYNTATGQTTEMAPADAAEAVETPEIDGEAAPKAGAKLLGGLKKGLGIASKVGRVLGEEAIADKNFGSQSAAIDAAVNGVSGFLESTGNPYAIIASKAIQKANFLTKAGGQTVEGFDVDINSSGYGQMGHMESSSSRDFGAMIGLGGIFGQKSLQRKLQKRNQQALMAMNAANIAEDQKFEQEARMNSIQNVIMNNQIALSGGLETNLLGG